MVACKDQVNILFRKSPFMYCSLFQTGVNYSSEMEVFALKSLLNFLKTTGIKVSVLVTDRSTTVRALMNQEFPEIRHQFDVWQSYGNIKANFLHYVHRHFIKGIKNWIIKASRLVRCTVLKDWQKSVVNMLWWSLSTAEGNENLFNKNTGGIS